MKVGLAPTFCFRWMYRQNTQLQELINPVVSALGYEMLGIEIVNKGRGWLVRIYIDKPSGICLDDCAKVSHQVAGILDVNDPIKGPYELEISSPGNDRPLFTLEQFRRFIGEMVRIHLVAKIEGRRKITGIISSVTDDAVEIEEDGHKITVQENFIDKARLVP